jgi:hypothetical protein
MTTLGNNLGGEIFDIKSTPQKLSRLSAATPPHPLAKNLK